MMLPKPWKITRDDLYVGCAAWPAPVHGPLSSACLTTLPALCGGVCCATAMLFFLGAVLAGASMVLTYLVGIYGVTGGAVYMAASAAVGTPC